ncbi:MAG: hypothetical protein A3K03_09255 [Bdellovibrionales bacterium RIFOXYD1_FULL_44_7]|nr:MAG: hypothetical protein A3K03_09255 [Bdellovibrionales bacterium RIFOXYD1_FULL_44_7]
MLALAFLTGWHLTQHFVAKDKVTDKNTSANAMKVAIITAILGARIMYFVVNPEHLNSIADFFAFSRGGMVAYGGFIAATFSTIAYLKWRKVHVWRFGDAVAPALAIGTAITRVGCLLFGCDYGAISDLPWALSFPKGSPSFQHHFSEGLISADATASLPVHPTQIYESLYALLIFAILLWLRKIMQTSAPKISTKPRGYVFLTFVALYAFFRFLNEIIRADTGRGSLGPFSTSQFIAILTIGLAIWGFKAFKSPQNNR